MIHRKIVKAQTKGSREKGDLRPALVDDLPTGLNLSVLEYSADDKTCVVELWGSDHPLSTTTTDIQPLMGQVKTHKSVISELKSHPKSPSVIGTVCMGKSAEHKVDLDNKEVTFKGKKGKFKRMKKFREQEIIVLDEG